MSPTNRSRERLRSRENTCSNSYLPDSYGVDKLRLVSEINKPTFKSTRWSLQIARGDNGPFPYRGEIYAKIRSRKFRVDVYKHFNVWMCSFEFNPARVVDPDGYGLCRPSDLRKVIDEVMAVVRHYVSPRLPMDIWQVRRIDLAQNFHDVTVPGKYMLGLANVPRTYAVGYHLWLNRVKRSRRTKPGTLTAGARDGGRVTLYDKYLLDPVLCPPGFLRCEVQARADWCKRFGSIAVVEDLTEENIDRLFDNRTDWFGLESEIMTFDTACEMVVGLTDTDIRTKMGLLEYVLALRNGEDPKKSTAGKYGRLLRDLKIAPFLTGEANKSISRLDRATGTEVWVA